MAKRSSIASSSRPSSSLSTGTHGGRESALRRNSPSLPVASPTPPTHVPHEHSRTPSAATSRSATLDSPSTNGFPTTSPSFSPAPPPVPTPQPESPPRAAPAVTRARSESIASASTASVYSPKLGPVDDDDDDEGEDPDVTLPERQVDSPIEMDDSTAADTSHTHTHTPPASDSPPTIVHAKPLLEEPQSSSFMSSEPSARFSRLSGLSEDGETGIGLTMLQDFMGGGGSDSDEDEDEDEDEESDAGDLRYNDTSADIDPNGSQDMSLASDATLDPLQNPPQPDSDSSDVEADMSLDFPVPPAVPLRDSLPGTGTDSEYGGEEWEGASDIYDNYRYSRMSMASKMSRFSKASAFSMGPGVPPPPVPTAEGRPSVDSVGVGVGPVRERERVGSEERVEEVESVLRAAVAGVEGAAAATRRVPAPLTFAPEITSSRSNSQDDQLPPPQPHDHEEEASMSPLLHTSFGSPMSSPPTSTAGFTTATSAMTSPAYPSATSGAASALRQRLEIERGSPVVEQSTKGMGIVGVLVEGRARLSTQPIVMEDDESIPQIDADQSLNTSVSLSPEQRSASLEPSSPPAGGHPSSFSVSASGGRDSMMSASWVSEKKALDATFVVANPNPPPPYSPAAAASSSTPPVQPSPQPQPRSQPPPQSQSQSPFQPHPPHLHPPQPHPQSHPLGVPIARPRPTLPNANLSPTARTSLFMPHPHAPKSPLSPAAGPMYNRPPSIDAAALLSGPPPGSVLHTIHAALAMRTRTTTIYGVTEVELTMSVGPVPIAFSVDPPMNVPAHRMKASPASMGMGGSPRMGSPALPQGSPQMRTRQSLEPVQQGQQPVAGHLSLTSEQQEAARKAIPRANFFPKVQTARPRSRSFSGFDSQVAEIELPLAQLSGRKYVHFRFELMVGFYYDADTLFCQVSGEVEGRGTSPDPDVVETLQVRVRHGPSTHQQSDTSTSQCITYLDSHATLIVRPQTLAALALKEQPCRPTGYRATEISYCYANKPSGEPSDQRRSTSFPWRASLSWSFTILFKYTVLPHPPTQRCR